MTIYDISQEVFSCRVFPGPVTQRRKEGCFLQWKKAICTI